MTGSSIRARSAEGMASPKSRPNVPVSILSQLPYDSDQIIAIGYIRTIDHYSV
jgi:hypothetical protein